MLLIVYGMLNEGLIYINSSPKGRKRKILNCKPAASPLKDKDLEESSGPDEINIERLV